MATEHPMQLAMVGLGRMGANLVRRLMRDGHSCVVFDVNPAATAVQQRCHVAPANALPEADGDAVAGQGRQ